MKSPLDQFLKDLLSDMKYSLEKEDYSITITSKDIEKVEKLINRNKRRKAMVERHREVRELFERKFVDYRNKLVSIYKKTDDPSLKREIKIFLEEEQGDVTFNDQSKEMLQQKCDKCPTLKYSVLLNKVVLHDCSTDKREVTSVCDECLDGYSKNENFEWWSNH